ncbi:MAG: hypothetical protein JWM11_3927 [Planctomycetaceae bacterium]|nr:hypothetical protein [Planctomycetaceae bacterium]
MSPHLVKLLAVSCCFIPCLVTAQEKKELPPKIKVVTPLGITAGSTTPIVVRGIKLNDVTELRFLDLKTAPSITIKNKGAAKVPDKVPPEKAGDSQIELELTLPADLLPGIIRFIAVSSQGQSEPHQFVVLDQTKTIAEKEPNDGFATAQEIMPGQTVTGSLLPGQNVDVYRFSGKAGQKMTIEIQAARLGSVLDPFLMLHNAQGQLLAEIDDGPDGADPALEFTLPADGIYYLSVLDANDKESPLHLYLLSIK